MNPEEANAIGSKTDASRDIAERVAKLSPETLRLLAREIKRRKGDGAVRRSPAAQASPLVPIRKEGSAPSLFMVHPVGGGIVAYHDLARYLAPLQPVYALQNHDAGNREEEEPPSLEQMAARYISAIQTVQPQGPYLLGGASMGGTVAFEMALQLEAMDQEVSLVAMLDTPAQVIPHMHGQDGHSALAVELTLIAGIIASGQGKDFAMPTSKLDQLAPEEQIHCVFQKLQERELIPAALGPQIFRAALMTFRKNLNALERYVPRMYGGRVVNLRAKEVSAYMRDKAAELCDDPKFGWQAYCRQQVSVCFIPGDHARMNLEPHVRVTGAELQRCIDQAVGERI